MRLGAALSLVWAACSSAVRPVPVDASPDVVADVAVAPDVAPDAAPDSPPPPDCAECVTACLAANCPTQAAACQANECAPVGPDGGVDGGAGPDAFTPPNCQAIVQCLVDSQCNPLGGPGDPCFDACYGPACAEAQTTFDPLLDCAVAECVDDCYGCQ